jgi:hypothetical protein
MEILEMQSIFKRFMAVVAPSVFVLLLPPLTQAQSPGTIPPAQTQVVVQPSAPQGGFAPPAYGPAYYSNTTPSQGYLYGAASVIQAQGGFAKDIQQANIIKEQVKQAKLDTQRRMIEEWQWEKSIEPTLNQVQEKQWLEGVRWARGNPPGAQIWNAQAPNILFTDIKMAEAATGVRGPVVPLDPEVVKHINVTTGVQTTASKGSLGMFKDGAKFDWPLALADDQFDRGRAEVEQFTTAAVKELMSNGKAAAKTLRGLNKSLAGLRADLKSQVAEMPAGDYTRSVRYINELMDAAKQMQEPNAGNYFNGQWRAEGNTVGELVDNMIKKGVRFAPATPGSESYYTSLYQSLRTYNLAVARLAGGPMSPGTK